MEAIKLAAQMEGLIVDPTYTAKSMAGFIDIARHAESDRSILFIHTGGQPTVFGYEHILTEYFTRTV